MKITALVLTVTTVVLIAGACGPKHAERPDARQLSYAGTPIRIDGLRMPARAGNKHVLLAVDGKFRSRFWPGVNIGSSVPGTFPSEVAATRANYDDWLEHASDLGARVVRVYTILRPPFYDALESWNRAHPTDPIYVLHGVWTPEAELVATGNAWSPIVINNFHRELNDAVAVVHGDADLPTRHGHASGKYRTDVSQWVLGWSIGVEWDPTLVANTDAKNVGRRAFVGRFFRAAPTATPMESWIASMLDHVAGLEVARGWSRPLTFTNWVTVDPLKHPHEPAPIEDQVSIDAMQISATTQWPGGFFASYHAYPYYPDFLSLEPEYLRYRRPGASSPDPFAGYLKALRAHHRGQAVMITEFGQPTSWGVAHRGTLGRDQGDHSEQESARLNAVILDVIHEQGFAGGMVFELLDEWFKHTWNTMDYELPSDRRQLWRNVLTNEEHFGVVAVEPGKKAIVVLDGNEREWLTNHSAVLSESRGAVREVRAIHDEAYLYLRLRLDKPYTKGSENVDIGFDVRPGGNRGLPDLPGTYPEADVAVRIEPGGGARVQIAASTDPIAFRYGIFRQYIAVKPSDLKAGSGAWRAPQLILSQPFTVPLTGEKRPVEFKDLSSLPVGTADPSARGFDNRVLVSRGSRVIELRMPWALLGYSDPSSKQVLVPQRSGSIATRSANDKVGVGVFVTGEQPVVGAYGWDPWNQVTWHERRKVGWETLRQAFRRSSASSATNVSAS